MLDKTIQLTPEELIRQGDMLENISAQYRSTLKQVDSVLKRVNNNWSYKLANNFGTKIHSVAKSSEKLVTLLEQSSMAAKKAGESFTTVDVQLAKLIGGEAAAQAGNTTTVQPNSQDETDMAEWWKELILGTIGNFGIFGKAFELITTGLTTGDSTDIGKLILDLIGSGASVGGKIVDGEIVDIFGLFKTVDAIGFRENLAMQLEKFKINSSYNSQNLTGAAKTANNIGAIAKWGGVALTAVSKFVGNAEEFNGDFGNWRMYAETIGETAVSVGTGILVTAGVGALLGASAPAVLVGAIGTGIVAVGNWASESLFGVSVTEAVSDFAIDTATAVVDGVKDIGKAIGDGFSNAGKAIASWFK